MLGGYLLSVHSLLAVLLSVIWTPLIMLFFRRALIHPKFKNEFLTAFFLTISFLGGGVEIVYGNFFILLFMIIFLTPSLSSSHKSIWRQIGLGVKSLFVISIIFLLLSAVQIFPFVELLRHSIRWGGISYNEATIWSFSPKDILLFFIPDAYGYFLDPKKYWQTQCWLKTLYTGGLPFILGSFFFLFGKDRKLYISLMLFSIFISLGEYNPLYPFVFKHVPFFNGIRYPVKFLYIFILCLSIISGFGFQKLMEFSRNSDKKTLKNLLIIFSLTSGLILLFLILDHKDVAHFLKLRGIDFPDFNSLSVNLYHAKRFLFYLTLFFLLMRLGHEVKWKGWVKVLLIFFLIADLFGNMGFYGKEKTLNYFQKTKILEIISSDKGNFRTFTTGKTISMDKPILIGGASPLRILKEKHPPSLNLLYGLHDIWGFDVVRLKRGDNLYKALTGASSISATNLIDLYSVKYIISMTPIKEKTRFKLIYSRLDGLKGKREDLLKENTIKLYKNKDPLPRAWLVKDFKIMAPDAILSALRMSDFNPVREVFLEEKPELNPPSPPLSKEGIFAVPTDNLQNKVELKYESNNRLLLDVELTENAFLVLSDTYFPGWKVFIDGKKGKIYRADYNFRAVPLGAGKHQIEFIYDPLIFKVGAIITFLGIIGCLAIGLGIRHRKQ